MSTETKVKTGCVALLSLLLGSPAHAANGACSWSIEDDFATAGAGNAAVAVDVDPNSNVYVAGTSGAGTTSHWIVRSRKHGWSTVDDFIYDATLSNHPTSIAHLSVKEIYVAGGSNSVANNSGHWLVRRTTDSGGSWSTVDDFADPTAPAGWAGGITASGNQLYVVGDQNVAGTNYNWYVRTSVNGTTWNQDDNVAAIRSGWAIAADPSGTVLAVGDWWNGYKNHWVARKRSGTTWSQVDDFTSLPDNTGDVFGAVPTAVVAPANNTFYVGGTVVPVGSASGHWTIRKTTNGGASWTTVEDFLGSATNCNLKGMVASNANTVWVTGRCAIGGSYHWITRATTNGGASWTTVDDWQLAAGFKSVGNGISIAANGTLYAAGQGVDASGVSHWIVRRCK